MNNSYKISSVFFILIIFILFKNSYARQNGSDLPNQIAQIEITRQTFDEGLYLWLWNEPWKFHHGDSLHWADLNYDDSGWPDAVTYFREEQIPTTGWNGIGWFRLEVYVDSSFGDKSLAILGQAHGNYNVYWDGNWLSDNVRYIVPTEITVSNPGIHVLAVRYELPFENVTFEQGHTQGFFFSFADYNNILNNLLRQRSEQMFFTAFTLAFGFLHLILFIFIPGQKSNLYFSIFLFLFSAGIFADIQAQYIADNNNSIMFFLRLHRLLQPLIFIMALRFFYSVFYEKLPQQFWLITALMIVVGIIIVRNPGDDYNYYTISSTILQFELIRVLVLGMIRKREGAWILATGYFILGIFSIYDGLLDLELMNPVNNITNAYYFGMVGMLICMSVFLARDFSRTSKRLIEQERRANEEEIARKVMEADNIRKTKELDEARNLQLSMLPECLNDFAGLDICFNMDTATEVGGDYYDYHYAADGTLTIAVGDATGHGMKAGTMVSIIKSLFITQAHQQDIQAFLQKCSAAIKQMRLHNLYMALMLVKLKDHKMKVASAGMPPVYIYRKVKQQVDELIIKSMPLGGPLTKPYDVNEIDLASGDIVLLMSDGLAESFNAGNELFDFERVSQNLQEASEKSATGIVHHLRDAGINWRNNKAQADDITFVVIKIKE